MTIPQSKGLEFPVVVVGSLDTQLSTGKRIDRDLGGFYHRPPFEPENRITQFDRMRLHYSNPLGVVVWSQGFSRIRPPKGSTPLHNPDRIALCPYPGTPPR